MKLKYFILMILSLVLAGCGFQLRNRHIIPPQMHRTYLQSNNPYGKFTLALKRSLSSLGVKFTNSSRSAPVTLNLISTNFTQSSPNTIPTTQQSIYTFTYSATFSLLSRSGKILLPAQTVSAQQNLTMNPNQILENSPEITFIRQSLERQLIFQIQNILNSNNVRTALAHPNEPLPTATS